MIKYLAKFSHVGIFVHVSRHREHLLHRAVRNGVQSPVARCSKASISACSGHNTFRTPRYLVQIRLKRLEANVHSNEMYWNVINVHMSIICLSKKINVFSFQEKLRDLETRLDSSLRRRGRTYERPRVEGQHWVWNTSDRCKVSIKICKVSMDINGYQQSISINGMLWRNFETFSRRCCRQRSIRHSDLRTVCRFTVYSELTAIRD